MTPEPGCIFDREQAREAMERLGGPDVTTDSLFMDALAACVRPVAGVTLTPEEAALALRWKRDAVRHGYVIDIPDDDLTARLEAAQ